jgi:hypothetical protein
MRDVMEPTRRRECLPRAQRGLPGVPLARAGVGRNRISMRHSRVAGFVIKTDENLMIARHARALLAD